MFSFLYFVIPLLLLIYLAHIDFSMRLFARATIVSYSMFIVSHGKRDQFRRELNDAGELITTGLNHTHSQTGFAILDERNTTEKSFWSQAICMVSDTLLNGASV
jgi:hypothetical protein